jgi:hypothetical protein
MRILSSGRIQRVGGCGDLVAEVAAEVLHRAQFDGPEQREPAYAVTSGETVHHGVVDAQPRPQVRADDDAASAE